MTDSSEEKQSITGAELFKKFLGAVLLIVGVGIFLATCGTALNFYKSSAFQQIPGLGGATFLYFFIGITLVVVGILLLKKKNN